MRESQRDFQEGKVGSRFYGFLFLVISTAQSWHCQVGPETELLPKRVCRHLSWKTKLGFCSMSALACSTQLRIMRRQIGERWPICR
jgi:hypothetical protein